MKTAQSLDEINELVESSLKSPDFERFGYKFFFRPYLPSSENLSLVGLALAWKDKKSPVYYAVAGTQETGKYVPGEALKLDPLPSFGPDTELNAFLAAKEEALDRLIKFVLETKHS